MVWQCLIFLRELGTRNVADILGSGFKRWPGASTQVLYSALRKNSLQLWHLSLINSSNGYDWCRVWVLLYQGTVTLSGSPFVSTLSIGALFDRVSQY